MDISMTVHDCCARGANDSKGKYDLAIIGAGSAGFSAAITAAEQGARVAFIGHGTIGGTCVNIGCVPSKTLIRVMESLHHVRTASRFTGIQADGNVQDWRAVVRQKDELVSMLRQTKYIDLLPAYDTVTYLDGQARLVDEGIAVNGNLVRAGKVIIATGASPSVPPIPGMDSVPYLTSTTALELESLPESLLVIGGGYVGCELGQMFARAGVKVTIVCRSRLLPGAEPEIGVALTRYLEAEGVAVRCGLTYGAIERDPDGVALSAVANGVTEVVKAGQVLIATGRRPNTAGLGLEEAGIDLLSNGGIKVDARMRTTKSGVYAAGDVTGRDEFVYMAAYGARIAAENALNDDTERYDATVMPAVVFTDPQLASVGLTETVARERGFEVRISALPLEYLPRALAARDTRGLIKLVAEAETGKLLGAHILAPEGADSIQTAAMAIKCGLTVEQLSEMIFPYLTTVEGLKLAAQAFAKDVAKLSCCAG
ncbi:MAG: mercury(II) reductase [Alphaproteobacteria bacterium]|nr:mercury(II) reductase [Alphaproteobacteria bacterium]